MHYLLPLGVCEPETDCPEVLLWGNDCTTPFGRSYESETLAVLTGKLYCSGMLIRFDSLFEQENGCRGVHRGANNFTYNISVYVLT